MLVVPTLHPAFILRSSEGEKGEARFRHVVVDDLKKAVSLRKRRPRWDESVIWRKEMVGGRLVNLFPTVDEVERFVTSVARTTIAGDVEATGNGAMDARLICLGIASANGEAMCIPFLRQGGLPYWKPEEEERVRKVVGWLLADVNTPKVFHNGAFDTILLWAHGLPVIGWQHDTMLGHHAVDAEMPHSLAFLGSIYLEHPYWKDDVKGGEGWLAQDDIRLRSYNLRDCLVTIRCLPHVLREIQRWNLWLVYNQSLQVAQIMCRATIRGVEVDISKRYWLYRELKRQREKALGQLRRLAADSEFNPGSQPQLQRLLFETLCFPVVRRTEKVNQETGLGNPSTDKKAMTLLALHADSPQQKEALMALVRFRKVDKLISTSTGNFDSDPEKNKPGLKMLRHVDADGRVTYRVHAAWKQLVMTGRLSSSPNMQNQVPLIKAMFRAKKGRKLVAVDLSQAELRAIAYFADDKVLQEAYRLGLNVHTLNTTLLFGLRSPGLDTNPQTEEYLRRVVPELLGVPYDSLPIVGEGILTCPVCQDKALGPSKCPDHEQDAIRWADTRRLSKNFVFGDNYNAQADTIFELIKSQRDKKTDEPLFPNVTLGEIEACKFQWEHLHPAIPSYWKRMDVLVRRQGYYRTPIAGRLKRFRAGFKITEIVNFPIQATVADHMNEAMIRIAARLYVETNDTAQIIIQVHDALYIEAPDEYVDIVKQILKEELSKPRRLEPFQGLVYEDAIMPPDKPKTAQYLDAL